MPSSASLGTWEPNSTAFGEFATAIATRYDGSTAGLPRVSYWQAWNEPNLNQYLAPQWVQQVGGAWSPESPSLYRNLDNAFYTSVKAVNSANFVVGAGTAPYGDPSPGGDRMQPVTFDRYLFCLGSNNQPTANCPGPTYLNAVDDHPYVSALCCLGPLWHAALPADTSIPDVYKVVDVLKAAETAKTVAPAGAKPVWATELGWNTDPPNPDNHEASSPNQVALWGEQALYVLWSQGVNTVMWYQLADDPESSSGWDATYTEGLYYNNGAPKPAVQAFRFPFVTHRRTTKVIQAWGRAPRTGTLFIQEKIRNRWTSTAKLKVQSGQVFQVPIKLTGAASFRAVIGGTYSLAWQQSA